MTVSSPEQMYPSSDELFCLPSLGWHIREQLQQRYAEHGMEYATEEQYDGRVVNACMNTDSAQAALEELVDAVFNLCVLHFKGYRIDHMLAQAQQIWNDLTYMKGEKGAS